MITLKNTFHGTAVRIRADFGEYLTPAQIRRAREALCPVHSSGCTCGGNLGERDPEIVSMHFGYDNAGNERITLENS